MNWKNGLYQLVVWWEPWKLIWKENVLYLHLTLIQNFNLPITAFPQLFSNFSPQLLVNHKLHQSLLYSKFVLFKSLRIKSALIVCQLYFYFTQSALLIFPIRLYNSSPFWILSETTHEKRPIFTSHKTYLSPQLYFIECSACKRISVKVLQLISCLEEQAHNKFVSPFGIGKEQTRTVLSITFFSQTWSEFSFLYSHHSQF